MSETTMIEHPYSASFRLYGLDGLNVLFTVKGTEPEQHTRALATYLGALTTDGYMVNLPGTEPGERVEEIDAWVRGETSRDEPCVYLYSSNHGLKWRIATVYVEDLGNLPFPTGKAKTWPGSAPEREVAESKGYLNAVEPFDIVLKPSGKETESGNPVMKFDRVLGQVTKKPPTNGKTAPEPATKNGQPFYGAMAGRISFFTSADEVKQAMKVLGVDYPKSSAAAAGVQALLEAFAGLRADGVDEELAVIHVKDGKQGEPEPETELY